MVASIPRIHSALYLLMHAILMCDFRFGGEYEVQSSGMYCRVVKQISTEVTEVRAASIITAMNHRQYIPEDSELQF
jgi:hypothetical protein